MVYQKNNWRCKCGDTIDFMASLNPIDECVKCIYNNRPQSISEKRAKFLAWKQSTMAKLR